MDTTIMRMLKNSLDKGSVCFVKLTKAYNLLRQWVLMIRKKLFCKGRRIRIFCPIISQPNGIERLCYRCGDPRFHTDLGKILYFK